MTPFLSLRTSNGQSGVSGGEGAANAGRRARASARAARARNGRDIGRLARAGGRKGKGGPLTLAWAGRGCHSLRFTITQNLVKPRRGGFAERSADVVRAALGARLWERSKRTPRTPGGILVTNQRCPLTPL